MTTHTFAKGHNVTFLPGPRSTTKVTGTVTGHDGQFLVVKCDDKVRKIRPGNCTAA